MELLKQIFTNIDFHLDAKKRLLTILYGSNRIVLRLTEEGNVKLETDLLLDGSVRNVLPHHPE